MAKTPPEFAPSELADAPEGAEFLLPIQPNDSAPFLAVDNCIVISPPPNTAQQRIGKRSNYVEVIMMRTSLKAHAQLATMGPTTDENKSVNLGGFQILPFNSEIGRARFDVESAINLATGILKHVIDTCEVDPELVRGRLVDRGIVESQLSGDE